MKKTLLAALIALALPAASALAQANVVMPPQDPSAKQAGVLPPAAVTSVNPAAGTQAAAPVIEQPPALIDIAIPSAPRADAVGDLTPKAPVTASKKAPVKAAPKKETAVAKADEVVVKTPESPFAGIVGTPVSDSQLNRFVFPEAVEGVYFSEGAPLPECPDNAGAQDPCKPVFLNGKKVMLLQLRAGAKGPVQLMAHLHSGRFIKLNLMPAPGPGALVRVDGAEDGASDARLALRDSRGGNVDSLTDSEQNVAMLARFARGDIPAGYEADQSVAAPVRFEHFDVIPQASWNNGHNLRVHLMQVKAHGETPVAIKTSLFRNENVKALALDRETITESAPALLFMLEVIPPELMNVR